MSEDVYIQLSRHMADLAIGPPFNEYLVEMLRFSLTEKEAEILLSLPTKVAPFEPFPLKEIAAHSHYSVEELEVILNKLAVRGLLFCQNGENGEKGYALHHFGYGMPQALFWPNVDTPFTRRMAELNIRHSSSDVLIYAFGGAESKVYRWVPVDKSIEVKRENVVPYALLEEIIDKASVIAAMNCSCRVVSRLKGRPPCKYPLNVCMKCDSLAEYVIEIGIGYRLSKDEALALNRQAEEAGCVHFTDNTMPGHVTHCCNCCPCCCWSLGNLSRRRVPRDMLMACHFIRETDIESCTGCGACVEACPIKVVEMQDDCPVVDSDWCIGCGVCALSCPEDVIRMVHRNDVPDPFPDLDVLSRQRLAEKEQRKKSRLYLL